MAAAAVTELMTEAAEDEAVTLGFGREAEDGPPILELTRAEDGDESMVDDARDAEFDAIGATGAGDVPPAMFSACMRGKFWLDDPTYMIGLETMIQF